MADNYLAKYHVRAQQAYALLAPIAATLDELERRVQHYLDRVEIGSEADADALSRAHSALATAPAPVAHHWRESNTLHREGAKKEA